MTGKELIFKTLKNEETGATPWVPFAGVHAATVLGYTATEVLTDGDKLIECLKEVNRLYKPSGLPVLFDLQVEAECLGCDLVWADDAPPSVSTHPLEGAEDLVTPCDCTIPKATDGRLPMILDSMKKIKAEVGEEVALYGLICGPFTLATHLRGNDIFMDMYDDEDAVVEFLAYCTKVAKAVAGYYIEAGMDVIAVVDPLISQISAAHFREFMSEPFGDLFDFIRDQGALSSFFVCGDATRNVEEMCLTRPDAISVDENVDIIAAKEVTDKYDVCIGGNIPLTTVMLHGSQLDNMKYVVELLDKMPSKKNFILSPGCDMPFNVPVENTIAVAQAVLDTDSVREMVANYEAPEMDIEVILPDYANLSKPLVEVFTLDSATCAACTYMMGAANEAKASFGEEIDMIEYKFTEKENIARCVKMGVPNLPSLYINGEMKFRSIVPSKEELEQAIKSVM
ncbi:MAG: uroporphyrinogen decarboxylase family protein [Lachnospiraceae bacterium]